MFNLDDLGLFMEAMQVVVLYHREYQFSELEQQEPAIQDTFTGSMEEEEQDNSMIQGTKKRKRGQENQDDQTQQGDNDKGRYPDLSGDRKRKKLSVLPSSLETSRKPLDASQIAIVAYFLTPKQARMLEFTRIISPDMFQTFQSLQTQIISDFFSGLLSDTEWLYKFVRVLIGDKTFSVIERSHEQLKLINHHHHAGLDPESEYYNRLYMNELSAIRDAIIYLLENTVQGPSALTRSKIELLIDTCSRARFVFLVGYESPRVIWEYKDGDVDDWCLLSESRLVDKIRSDLLVSVTEMVAHACTLSNNLASSVVIDPEHPIVKYNSHYYAQVESDYLTKWAPSHYTKKQAHHIREDLIYMAKMDRLLFAPILSSKQDAQSYDRTSLLLACLNPTYSYPYPYMPAQMSSDEQMTKTVRALKRDKAVLKEYVHFMKQGIKLLTDASVRDKSMIGQAKKWKLFHHTLIERALAFGKAPLLWVVNELQENGLYQAWSKDPISTGTHVRFDQFDPTDPAHIHIAEKLLRDHIKLGMSYMIFKQIFAEFRLAEWHCKSFIESMLKSEKCVFMITKQIMTEEKMGRDIEQGFYELVQKCFPASPSLARDFVNYARCLIRACKMSLSS
jgi:hypothetical protein